MQIKGQEKSIESIDLTDRELARKKRAVKKRGANKKKRSNKKRVSSRGGRGNIKKISRNGRGNVNTKKRMDEMDSGKKKKASSSSGGKKKSNSTNNEKKKTSKASKKGGKSNKNDDKWYPRFDSIMCTSGGGRPLVGFNPMYYTNSKQLCCMRHFPSMAAECMIRSSGSSASMVASGAKPGMWGGSSTSWMGAHQPSWGAGGKSGKSGGTSTTVVYIAMPGEEDTEEPTSLPTSLPTTYIPTYYPTDMPTEIEAIETDMPTFSPTTGSEYFHAR